MNQVLTKKVLGNATTKEALEEAEEQICFKIAQKIVKKSERLNFFFITI